MPISSTSTVRRLQFIQYGWHSSRPSKYPIFCHSFCRVHSSSCTLTKLATVSYRSVVDLKLSSSWKREGRFLTTLLQRRKASKSDFSVVATIRSSPFSCYRYHFLVLVNWLSYDMPMTTSTPDVTNCITLNITYTVVLHQRTPTDICRLLASIHVSARLDSMRLGSYSLNIGAT